MVAHERSWGWLDDDAPRGLRDPLVVLAVVAGTALTAWALFAGRYLPGIDYSNHLALISVLAHGGESGALDYLQRSLAPTPYLLFYALTAALAQVFAVDVAAKLSLVISAALLGTGAASLASATGRSPRLGALAPLAFFGVSYGYGFVTFVFTTPLVFWTLAAAERLIVAESHELRRRTAAYAAWLSLTFLGHGLLFWTVAVLLLSRVTLVGLAQLAGGREGLRHVTRTVVRLAIGTVPALLLAASSIIQHLRHPDIEAGTTPAETLFSFEPWSSHLAQLGGHLLERGSVEHWRVMYAAAALFALVIMASLLRPRTTTTPRESRAAALIYAAGLTALFLVGPMALEWPSSVWYVYPRYGVLAGVALWLLPRARLGGVFGLVVVLSACGLVAWNARLNHGHIAQFSGWASRYDGVRAAIPPGSRVLALTVTPGGDFTQQHPALGSLYFYHLVDGASYTAFLLDKTAHPVHSRRDVVLPRAPFWRSPDSYDPRTHGVDFDYLVLRGPGLVARTEAAGLHERVAEIEGWTVYKTKAPTPRPSAL